ncbi:hypothetical protein CPC08DRAFT_678544 [Agrocybe pediades]|nr:hypothetical protein CPC08DRAFT_678544 [Agrocybe pediades]
MEKFSAYRDPGTGIQPFLTPVPPLGSQLLAKVTLPLRYAIATIRTALFGVLVAAYLLLVNGVCLVLLPIPPLHQLVQHAITFVLGRTALFLVGFVWIAPEQFNRKRSRGPRLPEKWNTKAGDVIISNWASWIEVLWLAIRFNPVFVLPVTNTIPESPNGTRGSTPVSYTPGRRTGTGSANVQMSSRSTSPRVPIAGFQQVSLLTMITRTGNVPVYGASAIPVLSLEEIRRNASGPVVVFPECTTSNGRGLLRFADVFHQDVPVKKYQVFVMSVRYDPPTDLAPTLTLPIPLGILNPLPHIFTLMTSLSFAQVTIRLLAPSESPGSQLFVASDVLSDYTGDDMLTEASAALIAHMGKLKRTSLGWEDKSNFLEFYRGKSQRRDL